MDYSSGNEDLERLLMELKMAIPALSSRNIDDRTTRDEGNPLIAKLAWQRTRGEREDLAREPEPNSKPAKFDNDIEDTISKGRYGEFGWLDELMEEMARYDRKAQGLPE